MASIRRPGPYIGEVKLTFFVSDAYLEVEVVAARGLPLVHSMEPGISVLSRKNEGCF